MLATFHPSGYHMLYAVAVEIVQGYLNIIRRGNREDHFQLLLCGIGEMAQGQLPFGFVRVVPLPRGAIAQRAPVDLAGEGAGIDGAIRSGEERGDPA